ncbi:MAG: hypothetical protein Q7S91_00980, partial [Aquabacterium sp.]|nr:hypothetical protein [Aquabacterium sp.]
MTMLQRLFSMMALLLLAACGGGDSDAGAPPFGSGETGGGSTGAAVADLDIQLSSATIPDSGTGTVT